MTTRGRCHVCWLWTVLLFAGCQTQRPTDPFLGRSTIPPPSTNFAPPAGSQPYYTPPTNSRPPAMQPSFGQPSAVTPPSLPPAGSGYGVPAPNYGSNPYPNYGPPGPAVPNYNPPNIPSNYPSGSAYPNNYPTNISPTYPPSIPPTSASGYGTAPGYGTSPPLNNSFTTPPNGGAPSWSPNSTPLNPSSTPYNGGNSFGAPNPQYMPPSGANYYPSSPNAFAWQPQPNPYANPSPNRPANPYPNSQNYAGNPYGNPYANPYYYPNATATGYTNPSPASPGTAPYNNGGNPNIASGVANGNSFANAYARNLDVPDNALVRVISPRAGGGYAGGSVLPTVPSVPVSTPITNGGTPNFAPPPTGIPGVGDNSLREPRRLDNILPAVEITDLTPVHSNTASRFTNRPAAYNEPVRPSVDVPLVQPNASR